MSTSSFIQLVFYYLSFFTIYHIVDDEFDFSICMEFYDIKQKLGQGGYGSVYLAWDILNQRDVALKILNQVQN
jgi:serine/threonine protein kinase